ncbi:sialate O-acetylesterase [Mucilaginibacter sp.]|jgi:sialate O-acetylesterase|uniref:sialate O-acetylesterase n=1 Tax=Mucilaginibacter sp. TaxID=1882438 RepID=UPI00356772D3
MILQRDQNIKIWGWAKIGDTINLTFNNKRYKTVTTLADSTWSIKLPATKAGGPYVILISSAKKNLQLNNVLFGDVWFCSGQSNMNFRMNAVRDFSKEKEDADYSMIRQFDGFRIGAETPQQDVVKGNWAPCNSSSIQEFSAVAFFFAKNLYLKNKVPIGIINASWGGSPIQTFMSRAGLQDFSGYDDKIKAITPTFIADSKKTYNLINQKWTKDFYAITDYISQDLKLTRNTNFFDSNDWLTIHVPGYIEAQGFKVKNGVSWYKKEVELDVTPTDDINIDLGRIKLSCVVFINGQLVGKQSSIWYNSNYKIPKGVLRKGTNEILVCSYNENGDTGFQPIYTPRLIINTLPQKIISINGNWLFKQGKTFDKPGVLGNLAPIESFEHQYPTLVYNSMIAPFFKYSFKGIVWYQGEDNSRYSVCYDYEKMLTNLIKTWRSSWDSPKLPFLIVQLANYHPVYPEPTPGAWSIVQEAQSKVGQNMPNTGFAVINDIGDAVNIHPTNKQEVGRRLALVARDLVYNESNITSMGPTYKSMKSKSDTIILSFKNMGTGLISKNGNGNLNAFCLAGKDSVFYRAKAKIAGDKVSVFSDKVPDPVYVRYAFEDNPGEINFYNKEGLPAVPFRTDNFPVKELSKKP